MREANKKRQQDIREDTDKLFQLATELKAAVDKTNENLLSHRRGPQGRRSGEAGQESEREDEGRGWAAAKELNRRATIPSLIPIKRSLKKKPADCRRAFCCL